MFSEPKNKPLRDPALGTTTSAPATLGDKNRARFQRATSRLVNGSTLYQLPSGQYKFNGNKFVPSNIAQRLTTLCHPPFLNNRGWLCYIPITA